MGCDFKRRKVVPQWGGLAINRRHERREHEVERLRHQPQHETARMEWKQCKSLNSQSRSPVRYFLPVRYSYPSRAVPLTREYTFKYPIWWTLFIQTRSNKGTERALNWQCMVVIRESFYWERLEGVVLLE